METERKKILLLGATFATGNMGVGALTAGALTIVARRFPTVQAFLLDYGTEASKFSFEIGQDTLDVPLINLRFSWKIWLPNNIALLLLLSALALPLGRHAQHWIGRRNRWLAAIDDADLALAVSGGDSFSDIYGMSRLFYVTLPQWLALLRGKRLVLLPQTIGPFDGRLARAMARPLMRRALAIYSRDADGVTETRHLLGANGIGIPARFCPDMGFVVEPRRPARENFGDLDLPDGMRQRPAVGLNVSGLLLMGGYTRGNMFKLNLDYTKLVEELVALFVDARGADVLLIPHVFGDGAESDTHAVDAVHAKLSGRFAGRLHRARGSYDQNEIKHVIGRCDFFVGSRMHACIAALSQAVPAVGVAYSDKFAGVFATVGVPELVADPRRLDLEQMLAAVARAFDARSELRARLEATVPTVQARVMRLLDEIE